MKQCYKLSAFLIACVCCLILAIGSNSSYAADPSGNESESSSAISQPEAQSSSDNLNASPGLAGFVQPQEEAEIVVRGSMGDATLPPRVNVMPGEGVGRGAPYAWPGRTLTIWGNVTNGTSPFTFEWTFGDGSPAVSGAVTNAKYINVSHAYATLGTKRAVLTVIDNEGRSDIDTVIIVVVPQTIAVEINAAIEDGLRYLYLTQASNGSWDYGSYDVAATSQAVLCFENQGHLPIADYDRNIYAEYIRAGLNYITSSLVSMTIGNQTYCNPEADAPGNTDHNNIGVYSNTAQPIYSIGMVMMALVGSGASGSPAPDYVCPNGGTGVIGRTYREIVVDMVDYCAWAQNESGIGRGGWRYSANYGSSDNSVTQWPVIGLEAAETHWGISAPECVKSELEIWINRSQIGSGAYNGLFYYSPNGYPTSLPGIGGAGLCEMAYCNIPSTDSRIQRCLSALETHWNMSYNKGFFYAMYAISKGCRITIPDGVDNFPGGFDWYADYVAYLLPLQNPNGSWPSYHYGILDVEWAILVLEQVVILDPIAVISGPESVPPDEPFTVDGQQSYHPDPDVDIEQWLWDFDASDGSDWGNPDASGVEVICDGYPLPSGVAADTFTITLRVGDNQDPPHHGTVGHSIIVDRGNHCPIADPGGPYSARVSQWITFDGTNSSDGDPQDPEDHIISYSWDLDGDGVFGDCTDSMCTYKWDYEYQGYVGLVVVDYYGCISDTAEGYVYVIVANVDVELVPGSIDFATLATDTVRISASVSCSTLVDTTLQPVKVRFYDGDPESSVNKIGDDQIITGLTNGDLVDVEVVWAVPDTVAHTIYVRVDPWYPDGPDGGALWEFNENNNEDSSEYIPYTAASIFLLPSPMRTYFINEVDTAAECYDTLIEIGPPGSVTCYCYDFDDSIDPDSIDLTSLLVNGDTMSSMSCAILDNVPLWTGQKVLQMFFPRQEFVESYGWVMDTTYQMINISGGFVSGDSTFLAIDRFMYVGHLTGDVDKNGRIDASDVVYLISYIFKKGPAPEAIELADTDCDGRIIVADLVYLINFYYKNSGRIGCE